MPAFLVDELRGLAGSGGLVENANDLLIDPADGLRIINEAEQLAVYRARRRPDLERGPQPPDRAPAGAA